MKVLVFGGTRFFGKTLVKSLIEKGYDVTIATRGITDDEFGDKIRRIMVERSSLEDMKKNFTDKNFDIVFDNICYLPISAKSACEVFEGKVKRYIFTSSSAVYEKRLDRCEEDFNPYTYQISDEENTQIDYAERKRISEAILFQNALFDVVAVRLPVVIGVEDYTNRLFSYVEYINDEVPFYVKGQDKKMSFITAEEAGTFISWIGEKDFIGPINACSNGVITVNKIKQICEKELNKKAILLDKQSDEKVGAYNEYAGYTLKNDIAIKLGFRFKEVDKEVENIIKQYIKLI